MRISFKSFALGFGCAVVSLGAVTYVSASNDTAIKACANKKTGAMRYIAKGSCKKTETLLSWNIRGPQGMQGAAGAKGDTGTNGVAGAPGTNARLAIAELSICGDDGATLCTVGRKGPGGGLIFYVDYNDQYPGFNYLEAAPTDAPFSDGADADAQPDISGPWATSLPVVCRNGLNNPCHVESIYPALTQNKSEVESRNISAGLAATQRIISLHPGIAKTNYAAGAADDYISPPFRGSTKSDWYLPSTGAMRLIQTNLIEMGLGNFTLTSDGYWTSTTIGDYPLSVSRWSTYNDAVNDEPFDSQTPSIGPVRPIRAF